MPPKGLAHEAAVGKQTHRKPPFVFGHFKPITSNAVPSAPVAGAQAEYPVLLFLEGLTGFRQLNTYQVDGLVSHGYIVAAIDQPGAAAAVVFPDGRQVSGMTLAQTTRYPEVHLESRQP